MRGSGHPWTRRLLSVAVIVLPAAAVAAWFFANYERKPVETRTQASVAARRNPLLAAEHFLARVGMAVRSHRGRDLLIRLPPPGDGLLVLRMTGNLTPSQVDSLLAWIRSGGHLLLAPSAYTAEDEEPAGSGILARIGVVLRHRQNRDCGCDSDADDGAAEGAANGAREQATGNSGETGQEDPADGPVRIRIGGHQVALDFPAYSYLEATERQPDWRITDSRQDGDCLLRFGIGAGTLTVLSSMEIFTNDRIGSLDHAFLLAWLVRHNHKTWLLYSSNMEGIFTLLRHHQPGFFLALGVALVLLAWSWQFRIGPLRREDRLERRNLLAHIEASGRFAWRLDRAASLIAANREHALRRWAARCAGRPGVTPDAGQIAARSGMTRTVVEWALFRKVGDEQECVQAARCLQKLDRADREGNQEN